MNGSGESAWKLLLGILLLIGFLVIGIAHIIKPDYFIERSAVRRGGELLSDWNRTGFQLVGLAVTVFSGFGLYELLTGLAVLIRSH